MRRSPSQSNMRVETMQDVGGGPSPFGPTDDDQVDAHVLVTLIQRPVPRPPKGQRGVMR